MSLVVHVCFTTYSLVRSCYSLIFFTYPTFMSISFPPLFIVPILPSFLNYFDLLRCTVFCVRRSGPPWPPVTSLSLSEPIGKTTTLPSVKPSPFFTCLQLFDKISDSLSLLDAIPCVSSLDTIKVRIHVYFCLPHSSLLSVPFLTRCSCKLYFEMTFRLGKNQTFIWFIKKIEILTSRVS